MLKKLHKHVIMSKQTLVSLIYALATCINRLPNGWHASCPLRCCSHPARSLSTSSSNAAPAQRPVIDGQSE